MTPTGYTRIHVASERMLDGTTMNISFDEARSELMKAQTEAMWADVFPCAAAPENLYHYTNAIGLQGIVKSKSLWASDLHFLNDRSELIYGHNLIRNYLLSH